MPLTLILSIQRLTHKGIIFNELRRGMGHVPFISRRLFHNANYYLFLCNIIPTAISPSDSASH